MLFNSYEFILFFLPATLVGFFALGVVLRSWALGWLILASLFFYAWWRPVNVLLIAPSILINFAIAVTLERLRDNEKAKRTAGIVLFLGIAFNVVFLGFFKYLDFTYQTINDVFGQNLVLRHIILPLGISFITFQKIAFLIDVHAGRVKSFTLRDYCLFVLFFPQLIAGPIVHYREMMPQFQRAPCRFDMENLSVGLTIFIFGLFKKTFLADHIAPLVTPIYEHAATVGGTTFFLAWIAAVGFTLQIYFDFSGYTDMALGTARFFGIRLPPNFNSPLRASSIIDFWMRWHMTLTRFLTAYIYNPLVLILTRRRQARGRPGFGGPNTTIDAFVYLLMFPTLTTMLISGLWHGAGYGFVIWGLLHGCFLTINHAWRLIRPKLWPDRDSYGRFMNPVGWLLTFVSVTAAMVFFRSATVISAVDLVKGMIGLNGVALPTAIYEHVGPLTGWLQRMGVVKVSNELWSGRDFMVPTIWIIMMMFIALALPNTLQILAQYEPALGVRPRQIDTKVFGKAVKWNASLAWAIVVSVIGTVGILTEHGPSEFLYWQF